MPPCRGYSCSLMPTACAGNQRPGAMLLQGPFALVLKLSLSCPFTGLCYQREIHQNEDPAQVAKPSFREGHRQISSGSLVQAFSPQTPY